MINLCQECGAYRPDQGIDPEGPYAICPECGHKRPFLRLPLCVVDGASGVGKSAVCSHLLGRVRDAVLLEADILWLPAFDKPEEKYRAFFETWLRLCKNISQSGRPVALFCAGGIPENVEGCVERRYFDTAHYLALTCTEEELAGRLRKRPAWRGCGDAGFIRAQVDYNQWFMEEGSQGEPAIELIGTSGVSVERTAEEVARWIRQKVG